MRTPESFTGQQREREFDTEQAARGLIALTAAKPVEIPHDRYLNLGEVESLLSGQETPNSERVKRHMQHLTLWMVQTFGFPENEEREDNNLTNSSELLK